MTRSIAALIACLVTLTACTGSLDTPAAEKPARFTTDRCADLVVIGARGQAQTAKNVGGEIIATTKALVDELPDGATVRLEGVHYDASLVASDAVYTRNVKAGARRLLARVAALAKACPDSHVGLIGFSAGADVVHRAALRLGSSETVAVIALIGDPRRNPSDRIRGVSYGTGKPSSPGFIGLGAPIPATLRDRTISFCVVGDEVCSSPVPGRSTTQSRRHKEFYEQPEHARETARVMADVLERTLDD